MKTFLALVSSLFLFASVSANADQITEGLPFTKVAFQGQYVQVEYDATTYYLISIDGVKTETILAACAAQFGADCEKLFVENFVQLLSSLAIDGTDWNQAGALEAVDLELYFFTTHRVTLFEDVAVTAENRDLAIVDRLLKGL